MQHRETLLRILEDCVARSEREKLSLGEVLESLKTSAIALSTVLLCLPFMQPLTLGPLSSAGGLVLASFGLQLWQGRAKLWLPQRLYQIKLWERLLGVCRFVIKVLSKVTRERLVSWTDGRFGERIAGAMIMTGGVLLVIPAPILPFNNTLPALSMLFAAIAVLERDGLMLLVSAFWLLATIAYFSLFFYAVIVFGSEAGVWLTNQWKGLIG